MASLFNKAPKKETEGTTSKPKVEKPPFTLKPTKQTCVALGVLSSAVLAVAAGLFIWQTNEISQIEAQVKQKQDEVANGSKIAANLDQVRADYSAMNDQLRYLETSVSPGEYVPTLLKQMERLAKQVSLTVQSTRPTLEPAPEPPADKEARKNWLKTHTVWPYDKLHVEMDVSGTYWNIARLLYRLNNFEKIIAVENVQITPLQDQGDYTHKLNVKLRLTGFIFKTQDANPKPDAGSDTKPAAKTAQATDVDNTTQTRA
jgi:Tfp pilus assembly protein PilO